MLNLEIMMLQRRTAWISFKFKDCEPLERFILMNIWVISTAAEWLIAQETSKVLFEMFPWWKYPILPQKFQVGKSKKSEDIRSHTHSTLPPKLGKFKELKSFNVQVGKSKKE